MSNYCQQILKTYFFFLPKWKHRVDQESAEDNLPNSLDLNMLVVFVSLVLQPERY